MGYIKAWADFQDAAEAVYAAAPAKVCPVCLRECGGVLTRRARRPAMS
jgi:hypothetical protein